MTFQPGIDVGHQAVAKGVVVDEDLLRFGAVGPELVLARGAGAVDAEDGAEGAELEPADEEFAISGIVGVAAEMKPPMSVVQ